MFIIIIIIIIITAVLSTSATIRNYKDTVWIVRLINYALRSVKLRPVRR
jgi:hypothetical protein